MTVGAFISQSSITTFVGHKHYPGSFTGWVFMTCFIVVLAGLIVGYEIGISGGVMMMPHVLKVFKKGIVSTNQYCAFRDHFFSLFTSSSHLGAFMGVVIASHCYKVRNISVPLISIAATVPVVLGALILTGPLASHLYAGRVVLGFGVGIIVQCLPLYLSEVAPQYFGGYKFIFQLMIALGILCANLINFGLNKIGEDSNWGYSNLYLGVLGLVAGFGSVCLPSEHHYLIQSGHAHIAKEILVSIRGTSDVSEEYQDLLLMKKAIASKGEETWTTILKKEYRPQFVMALAIPLFQQLTGINAIIFYAPILSHALGSGTDASLEFAVVIGVVNFIATLVASFVVDKIWRRNLFVAGGITMFVCEIAVGLIGGANSYTGLLAFLCFYLLGFACSWGTLGWLVPSEIFPLEIRLSGYCMMVALSMLFTFVNALFFPAMFCKFQFSIFFFYAAFVLIMTAFVIYLLPETKDLTINQVSQHWGHHWFWKRYTSVDAGKETI